jgi:aldehyde dehydrogenase (NAD+)
MLAYETEADIAGILSRYEKPLSLYVFATDKEFIAAMLRDHSFGGGCANDVVIHLNNKRLPFGGVGHSGMGASHGKHGFDTFTHNKSIVRRANWLDLPARYAPYAGKLKSIRKLLKWL